MNLVIACGGTGGHLFPGLAVAEEVTRQGGNVLILISRKEIDSLAAKDYSNLPNFRFAQIPSVGLPKILSTDVFSFALGLLKSWRICRKLYQEFQPDAILGMGGFTSAVPIALGNWFRKPTFLHESNAIPGKANRLNAKLSDRILLGFQSCAQFFNRPDRITVTGTPIRTSLLNAPSKESALRSFGWEPDSSKKILLIIGGSQGARGLNEAVLRSLPWLQEMNLKIIHFTGSQDEKRVTQAYQSLRIEAFVAAFSHQMQNAYAVADLAIARSGAASLTELSHFGIPSILIPYPYAAEDHQTLNANLFVKQGASVLIPEKELANPNGEKSLAALVRELLNDSNRLYSMHVAGKGMIPIPANAAVQIVNAISSHVRSTA